MKRKIKKSFWMPFILFLYTTAMAIYFLPRNTELSDKEKWGTIGMSYVVVALLWWVLRKKEKLMEKRNQEIEKTYKNNNN
jgi:high-affinity Fe2+/Pb2+ permease